MQTHAVRSICCRILHGITPLGECSLCRHMQSVPFAPLVSACRKRGASLPEQVRQACLFPALGCAPTSIRSLHGITPLGECSLCRHMQSVPFAPLVSACRKRGASLPEQVRQACLFPALGCAPTSIRSLHGITPLGECSLCRITQSAIYTTYITRHFCNYHPR